MIRGAKVGDRVVTADRGWTEWASYDGPLCAGNLEAWWPSPLVPATVEARRKLPSGTVWLWVRPDYPGFGVFQVHPAQLERYKEDDDGDSASDTDL